MFFLHNEIVNGKVLYILVCDVIPHAARKETGNPAKYGGRDYRNVMRQIFFRIILPNESTQNWLSVNRPVLKYEPFSDLMFNFLRCVSLMWW